MTRCAVDVALLSCRQASMEEAGRAVRALRHTQRKLIGEAAGFAHAVAPELALQLPVILGPVSQSAINQPAWGGMRSSP